MGATGVEKARCADIFLIGCVAKTFPASCALACLFCTYSVPWVPRVQADASLPSFLTVWTLSRTSGYACPKRKKLGQY